MEFILGVIVGIGTTLVCIKLASDKQKQTNNVEYEEEKDNADWWREGYSDRELYE